MFHKFFYPLFFFFFEINDIYPLLIIITIVQDIYFLPFNYNIITFNKI